MADPYKNNVVLYLPMEGTRHGDPVFVDKTGKTFTTLDQSPTLSTAVTPPFGTTSAYFDGSTNYNICVSNGQDGQFAFGTEDFTVECWYYCTDVTASQFIYDTRPTGQGSYAGGIAFGITASSLACSVSGTWIYSSGVSVSSNVWTHVAFVRKSGVLYTFINGILRRTDTLSTSLTSANTRPLIGAAGDNYVAWRFRGYLKDLRVTKGVARYTANFSPFQTTTVDDGYWANVVLAIHGEGTGTTFTDVSNGAKTITTAGNTTHSTAVAPPFGTSSIYFDGTGDYLSVADSADFYFGSGDFTIEFWMRSVGGNAQWTQVLAICDSAGNNNSDRPFTFARNDWSSYMNFSYWNGSTVANVTCTHPVWDGAWHHLAVCRYGSKIVFFVDGVVSASGTYAGSFVDSSQILAVGRAGAQDNWYYNGYLKDLRITKGVARYTQDFTPKYHPFPDKTAIKTIAKPFDWDEPEQPRIML